MRQTLKTFALFGSGVFFGVTLGLHISTLAHQPVYGTDAVYSLPPLDAESAPRRDHQPDGSFTGI